jgi:hypothetical protein
MRLFKDSPEEPALGLFPHRSWVFDMDAAATMRRRARQHHLNNAEGRRTYANWLKSLTSTRAAALPAS